MPSHASVSCFNRSAVSAAVSAGILDPVEDSIDVGATLTKADAATRPDNMDFIYLDVWYQDAWETRRIAEEINSLGWRFSTEFSGEGEYDSTWQHWSTDTTYGGAGAKGLNSDIIRFLRNDQRDSQVLNWPNFGGTADNPLLGGFRLYGFEGWGGQQDFNSYIEGTFNENVPTKFLQHYQVIDWENYADGESPVGNTEKQITLTNDAGDVVIVTRNEEQRSDIEIERTITLNGKVVLNTDVDESTYLLPWTDNQNGEEKLYHWNLDGGTTTWNLQDDWTALENVVMYKLTDQGRVEEQTIAVVDGTVTLTAEAATAYVVVKGAALKELESDFGERDYVVDPGFNGYVDGAKLDGADWSGDIDAEGVAITVTSLGDQKLVMSNTEADVAVSTTISGLTVGEDYVAEIYVANESDAKAAITVDAGEKVSESYTYQSIVTNTISSDSEHGTKMQRMLVTFVAESDTATLTLSREAGSGYTHFDDIRVVNQKLDNYKEDGSFEQDFESVVQGLYPFVLKYNAGGDSRTHLSQKNEPYTQAGWNGKSVDDVIDGEWSLKHHTNITGVVYQTIPQNFRFEAGKAYQVEFDYQTISAGYQMIVGDGSSYTAPTEYLATTTETTHATMQVIGSGTGQTWIGLYMNGSLCGTDTAIGDVDFILDNLKITQLDSAEIVTVSKTDLLLGESADIYGSSLDKITWTASVEGIVEVDQLGNKIRAVGAGTTVLTATFESGTTESFTFTVEDTIISEIDRNEYPDITASANTEEAVGEGSGNGIASAATDGNSSTFWHTEWYASTFAVSATNPAVITVDLGTTLSIGAFKFQQRPSANNGIVQVYSYRILDADGNVLDSGDSITVPTANRTGGAWTTQKLNDIVDARFIEISVLEGQGGFAAIAEIVPLHAEKIVLETCDHTPGEAVRENEVAATCEQDGSYESVVYCTACSEELSRETVTVPATGHSYENGVCTICGHVETVAVNTATNETYDSLEAALDAALTGETVKLLADVTENTVMVIPGVTLDLNGFQLTAAYAVGFDSAHIIDSVGTGCLVIALENLVLDAGNAMIPVYDGAGYVFTKAGFAIRQDAAYTGEGIKINALACPVRMDVVELLKDGGADNNVEIVIQLSWNITDETGAVTGTGSQEFVFNDQVVGNVYSSNNGTWNSYGQMFSMVITGFEEIDGLNARVLVVSGTNAVYVSSQSLSIT